MRNAEGFLCVFFFAPILRQFAHPAQPVLKKLPPGQGEPPARFRCPNRPVQKKGDARTGRSAYAPRVHQKAGAEKKECRTRTPVHL